MHFGILFLAISFVVGACEAQVPPGFLPISPQLPINPLFPPTTQKPVPTPKPTFAPKTKPPPKPTTTKQPATAAPVPNTTPNCGLTLNVPNSNCQGGNAGLQQTLSQLKLDLDNARARNQAQNQALSGMVATLQAQQTGYLKRISDLQDEVKNLVAAYNSISSRVGTSPSPGLPTPAPTPAGPSTAPPGLGAVQQAVQNVRDDLTTAVRDANSRMFSLSAQIQSTIQHESQAHLDIEKQLVTEASDIGKVAQRVQKVEQQLQRLNTTGITSPVGGATKADVSNLEGQIKKVEQDIQNYDQNQQQQYQALQTNTSRLAGDVAKHTGAITGLDITSHSLVTRLRDAEQQTKIVHDALAQLRPQFDQRMKAIETEVNDLKKNASSLAYGVRSLQDTVFNVTIKSTFDRIKLGQVKNQTDNLDISVAQIRGDLSNQKTEIDGLKTSVTDLKSAVPGSSLTTMNALVNKILQQGASIQQSDVRQLQAAFQTIQAALSRLSAGTTPSG